jgi:hypothetical protein
MPRRMDMGILRCSSTLSRPPSARSRMSIVRSRRRPSAKPLPLPLPLPAELPDAVAAAAREEERAAWSERILLSEISRWRARSLARKAALSSSGPSSSGLPLEEVGLAGSALGSRGGREDLRVDRLRSARFTLILFSCMSLGAVRAYHKRFHLPLRHRSQRG